MLYIDKNTEFMKLPIKSEVIQLRMNCISRQFFGIDAGGQKKTLRVKDLSPTYKTPAVYSRDDEHRWDSM